MKNIKIYQVYLFLFFLLTFTSCELIGDIFQAGIWVGIIAVVIVVALVIWLIKKIL